MGTSEFNAGSNPAMDSHPIQGGVEILLVASCYRNRDKLRPGGTLAWLVCRLYPVTYVSPYPWLYVGYALSPITPHGPSLSNKRPPLAIKSILPTLALNRIITVFITSAINKTILESGFETQNSQREIINRRTESKARRHGKSTNGTHIQL